MTVRELIELLEARSESLDDEVVLVVREYTYEFEESAVVISSQGCTEISPF